MRADGCSVCAAAHTLPRPQVRLNLGERFLSTVFAAWRQAQSNVPTESPALPELSFTRLSSTTAIIYEDEGVLLKCPASALPTAPPEVIPDWVSDCVLHGTFTSREASKLSFYLSPHDPEDLPDLPLSSSKLAAPRVLKLHKVARLPRAVHPRCACERALVTPCSACS